MKYLLLHSVIEPKISFFDTAMNCLVRVVALFVIGSSIQGLSLTFSGRPSLVLFYMDDYHN